MANTLMFEVGIKSAQEQLDKIKKEFKEANGELTKLLKIQVQVDGIDTITKALSQIGDSKQLQNLRQEIEAINKEFLLLAKGAGGVGDISARALKQQMQQAKDAADEYGRKIEKLKDEQSRLSGGKFNPRYGQINSEIEKLETQIDGANSRAKKFEEQLANLGSAGSGGLKNAGNAVNDVNTRLEQLFQSINSLSNKTFTVNMGNEFKTWSEQVQALTGQVKELVTQMEKLHQAQGQAVPTNQQNGLFDTQKFSTLQEAVDKIITEINRLQQAFTKLGENNALSNLTTYINGLAVTLGTLSNSIKLQPLDEQVKQLIEENEKLKQKLMEVAEAARYINVRKGDKTQEKANEIQKIADSQKKVSEETEKTGKAADNVTIKYQTLIARIENWQAKLSNLLSQGGNSNYFDTQIRQAIEAYGKALRSAELGNAFDVSGAHLNTLRQILQLLGVEYANVNKEAAAFNRTQEQAEKNAFRAHQKENAAAAKAQASEYKAMQKNAQDARREAEKLLEVRESMLRSQAGGLQKILTGGRDKLDTYQYEQVRDALRAIREELRQIEAAKQRGGLSTGALLSLGGGVNDFSSLISSYRQFISGKKEATSANEKLSASEQQLASSIKGTTDYMKNQSQVLSDLKMMAMQYLSVWGAQNFINNIIELGGQLEQQRLSIGAILQDTAQANHLFSQIKDLAIKSPFGVQQLDAMTKQLSAYGFQYSELYNWTKRLADISAATGTSVDRLALALGHVRSEGALSGYTLRQFSMGNIPLLQKLSENLGKTKQEIRKMTRNKEIGYEDVLNVLKQLTDEGGMFFEAQETMAQALNAKFKNLRDSFQIMYSEMAEGAPGDFLKKVAETLTDISKAWRILMPMVIAGGAAFGAWRVATMAFNYEAAHTGKLMTMNALATSKYSVAQLRAIATTSRFTLAMRGLRRALLSIGKFVFNPVTLGFAAIEGLIYLWSKNNDEIRRAKELTEAYSETAKESQKNLSKQLENINPFNDGMSDSQLKTGIDTMTEAIKNYGVNGQQVLNEMAKSSMTLAEKYQYLRDELEKTKKVYEEMERTADAFEYGMTSSDGGWLDDDVQTDLNQYSNAVKDFSNEVTKYSSKYGDAIEKAIEAAKKADPQFAEATKNMKSYGNMLIELWENTQKYSQGVAATRPFTLGADPEGWQNIQESYSEYTKKKNEAMKELDQFFENTEKRLSEQGYDFSKELAPEQVGNLLKQSKDWLDKHPEWSNIYDVIREKLKGRWGIEIVPDPEPVEEELPKWIQDYQKELDEKKTGIKLTANMSPEQIIDEMKKAYDTAQTTINKLGPIALNAKINFQGLTAEDIEQYRISNPELYQTLSDLIKANEKKNIVENAAKKRGVQLEGMKKDGSHKNAKEKKNQEAAKAVREQVRVIKEAADAFQYWREKVGDKGAWTHVQAEFGDVLNKIDITADNIENVRTHLNNIPNTKAYKSITDKKVKTEIDKEIAKENDQFIRKDFERDTEKFLAKTQNQIESLTRAWEIFNNVREATGNVQLAIDLSGAKYGENRNFADSLKEKIQKDFDEIGSSGVSFNINLDDDQLKREVENAIPRGAEESVAEYEDRISGLVEEYKKWRDLQRDVVKNDIQNFGKLLGSVVDYESEMRKVNDEYEKQKEMLDALFAIGKIDQQGYDNGMNLITIKKETEEWQRSTTYIDLMNHSLAMTKTEIDAAAQAQENNLNAQLRAGSINAEQYYQEIVKLRKITSEWSTDGFLGSKGAFGSFVSGGSKGLLDYYDRRRNRAYNDYARAVDKDSPEAQDKLAEAQHFNDLFNSFNELTDTVQDVVNAFQTLQSGVGLLENLFDSLGMESASNAMSDAGGLLSGALGGASSLSSLGPWGMAAGAALGLATSIFQLHDKGIQRQIDALKENNDALEQNTDAIKKSRERTLGYDTGALRRSLASTMYNNATRERQVKILGQGWVNQEYQSAAVKAMSEYYSRNTAGTGYKQELENLKEERENYIKMYDLEADKKKSSQDALNEYKEKIAELDDQINNYVEDLANELWGIDFKAWADQISDALWTAFENGEDAVEAFRDTAKDIIADVAKKMMNLHFIEPAFAELEEALFGKINTNTGKREGGIAYNQTTGALNEEAVLKVLGEYFGEGGAMEKQIDAAKQFYELAQKASGIDFSSDESKSSTGTSIKSITEQTADIMAGYLNSCRADLSVIRASQAIYFEDFKRAMTSGNASLRNIENHTEAIMRSNEAISQKVGSLESIMKRVTQGGDRVRVS